MPDRRTITKFVPGAASTLGERQIKVVASTSDVDRDGDVLDPGGCDLRSYWKNPIVLAGHDPTRPIGTAAVTVSPSAIEAVITFAPAGLSADADQACALAKAGILRGVSVGFRGLAAEPIRSTGGRRFTSWELLEISLVSVPANPSATVTAKAAPRRAQDAAKAKRLRLAEVARLTAPPEDPARAKRLRQVEAVRLAVEPVAEVAAIRDGRV